ncbi:hypothetical protein M0657_006547 [Pyricularia oryzae]|uniref:Uncharacterized protein n=3 Tax=Pyricularia oryzae TaxID=318829 RepID=A0A4P7NH42_PYROR|nr:hypothetical protein OOU_Y34scaffold00037g9 [Pyricularia oryzae Y34]KAI7918873.1 hypothetical protein M9X92_006658 [Pyricularia oryzae]KAI7920586.1 hypothetical protein M0657_006547 [Pyricularia oryzae]QBZ61220.1 hypothetical protein PoMZ_08168 [Pyricularia oryzae]
MSFDSAPGAVFAKIPTYRCPAEDARQQADTVPLEPKNMATNGGWDANFSRALCSCAPLAFLGHGVFQSKWKTNTQGF